MAITAVEPSEAVKELDTLIAKLEDLREFVVKSRRDAILTGDDKEKAIDYVKEAQAAIRAIDEAIADEKAAKASLYTYDLAAMVG